MPDISDEKLREIRDGCEGVTPGPWCVDSFEGCPGDLGKSWAVFEWGEDDPAMIYTVGNFCDHERMGRHIARLDPGTVRSIVTELLTRRAKEAEVNG